MRPVVVFPRWFLEPNPKGSHVWVQNPRVLPEFVRHERVCLIEPDLYLAAFHLSRFVRATSGDAGEKPKEPSWAHEQGRVARGRTVIRKLLLVLGLVSVVLAGCVGAPSPTPTLYPRSAPTDTPWPSYAPTSAQTSPRSPQFLPTSTSALMMTPLYPTPYPSAPSYSTPTSSPNAECPSGCGILNATVVAESIANLNTPTSGPSGGSWMDLQNLRSSAHVNWNVYREPKGNGPDGFAPYPQRYECLDFAIDLAAKATEAGWNPNIVVVMWEGTNDAHAFVEFNTTDMGVVWIEAQNSYAYVRIVSVPHTLCYVPDTRVCWPQRVASVYWFNPTSCSHESDACVNPTKVLK